MFFQKLVMWLKQHVFKVKRKQVVSQLTLQRGIEKINHISSISMKEMEKSGLISRQSPNHNFGGVHYDKDGDWSPNDCSADCGGL